MEVDRSLAQIFEKESPITQEFSKFQDAFGTNDILLVAITDSHSENPIFRASTLHLIDRLTTQLEKSKDLESVISITNLYDFKVEPTPSWLGKLLPKFRPGLPRKYVPTPYEEISSKKIQELQKDPFFQTGLLSPNGKTAIIWLLLKPKLKFQTDFPQRIAQLVSPLRKEKQENLTLRVTGFPLLFSEIQSIMEKDALLLLTLTFFLCLVTFQGFRLSRSSLGALCLSLLTAIATWVIYHKLSGQKAHLFTPLLFPFFFLIAVPALVHMEKIPYDKSSRLLTGKACLFAALTTIIGFSTLAYSPLTPLATLGKELFLILSSAFATIAIVLHMFPPPLKTSRSSLSFSLPKIPFTFPLLVIIFTLSAFPWFLLPPFLIQREADFLQLLPPEHPSVEASLFVQKELKAKTPFEIIVEFPEETFINQVQKSEIYKLMQEFEKDILKVSQGQIVQIVSPVTIVCAVNTKIEQSQKNAREKHFRVTPEATEFTIYWFIRPFLGLFSQKTKAKDGFFALYQHKIQQLVSIPHHSIRFGCRLKSLPPQELLQLREKLTKEVFPIYQKKLAAQNIYATGYSVALAQSFLGIEKTQKTSLILGISAIFALLFILLRSFKLWLIALITNTLCLISFFNLMALSSISLNIYTVILVAGLIGIIVDDSLHILLHYQEEKKRGEKNWRESLEERVFPSILLRSFILMLGFALFAVSSLPVYREFAILAEGGLLVALLWDLLFLPWCLGKDSGE